MTYNKPIQYLDMSNTRRDKKLASFNCDSELWKKFTQQCRKNGTTATAVLTAFISHYLDNSLDELVIALRAVPQAIALGKMATKGKRGWQQQVKALVEKYLEKHLPDYLM